MSFQNILTVLSYIVNMELTPLKKDSIIASQNVTQLSKVSDTPTSLLLFKNIIV